MGAYLRSYCWFKLINIIILNFGFQICHIVCQHGSQTQTLFHLFIFTTKSFVVKICYLFTRFFFPHFPRDEKQQQREIHELNLSRNSDICSHHVILKEHHTCQQSQIPVPVLLLITFTFWLHLPRIANQSFWLYVKKVYLIPRYLPHQMILQHVQRQSTKVFNLLNQNT